MLLNIYHSTLQSFIIYPQGYYSVIKELVSRLNNLFFCEIFLIFKFLVLWFDFWNI